MAALLVAAVPAALSAAPEATPADELKNVPKYGVEPRPNDYAVVIGIEKYRGKEIPPSEYSAGDADLVSEYLYSLGFRPSNVRLLKNEDATRDDFRSAIEGWLPKVVKPDSTVFFYYSGHGAPDLTDAAKPEAYLVPYSGKPNELAYTGYAVEELKEKLGKLKAAKVIVVLDSCFSGNGARSLIARGARPLMNQFTQVGQIAPNMAILTATGSDQISTSDPETGHGLLTYHFLKALRDGKTSLFDIYKQIKPLVEDDAARLQTSGKQSPNLVMDPAKKGLFVLADADKILEAKKKFEEENSQAKKLERMQAEKLKADQERLAAQQQVEEARLKAEEAQREALRKSEEAQREAERRLKEQRERLERENAERQAEQQRDFEAAKRRLEKMKRAAPQEEPAYVPPTF